MASIGENIRRIRKEKHLTLKQLAEKTLYTPQAIGQYERGERNPSYTILALIAKALDVPIEMLVGSDEKADELLANEINKRMLLEAAARERAEKDPAPPAMYDILESDIGASSEEILSEIEKYPPMIKSITDSTLGYGVGKVVLRFLSAWSKLNRPGRMKLIEFIEDFATIPKYLEVEENDPEE